MSTIDNESSSSSLNENCRNERIDSNETNSNSIHQGEYHNIIEDMHRPDVSATNDEVDIYTIGNGNIDRIPPTSHRLSPYDTNGSENLLNDDQTIDAAVVEEIREIGRAHV